jgi:hypothetical protein
MSVLHMPESFGEWLQLNEDEAITRPRQIQIHANPDEYELGSWWSHRRPDGHNCGLGRISYRHHVLEREDPLTIGGSLLCLTCRRHGFVRDGKWVEA